ncbi:MAG: hypothetical protein LUC50_07075 [Ruminococcus sp.]|nr:hypothetical protein [Ruminococcus sp.]
MDSNYVEIIRSYQEYAEYIIDRNIEGVFQDNIFTISNIDETLSYHWENMLIETNIWSYRNLPKDESAFGFALMDLNDNECKELILLLRDYTVLAIFTIANHNLTLIDAYWPKHRCAIFDTGMIYTLSSNSASQWYYQIQCISSENGSLKLLQEYGCSNDEYYKIIDEKKYSICEYDFFRIPESVPCSIRYGSKRYHEKIWNRIQAIICCIKRKALLDFKHNIFME